MQIQLSFVVQGASVLNFQGDGNSKKQLRKHWHSEEDEGCRSRHSHHAPEWKEQKSRMEGLRSRLLLWRSSPQWMRDDVENINVLLFRFVGKGFQLALCSVSWLTTRESVDLVPDPTTSAPWSVLLDRGEPCDSCRDTSPKAAFLRIGKSDVNQQPIAGLTLLAVCCSIGATVGVEGGLLLSSWRCVPFSPCPITSPPAWRPW